MEPDSGKILAMISKPDFNPNTISQDWDSMVTDETNSALLNRATQGLYPPGSTFKNTRSRVEKTRIPIPSSPLTVREACPGRM